MRRDMLAIEPAAAAERGAAPPRRGPLLGARSAVVLVLVLGVLYEVSRYSYLLFHAVVESFAVVIAGAVFLLAWNVRRLRQDDLLLFLGVSFLHVGAVDLLHMLAYDGMGVFRGYGPDLATQLWIVARALQTGSLLLAPLFLVRKLRPGPTQAVLGAVTTGLLVSVFAGWFPTCFVPGEGLTVFKKVAEYAFCAGLAGAALHLLRRRQHVDRDVLHLVLLAMAAAFLAEVSFTLYVSVYGLANLVGHVFKVVSFFLLYRAIVETGLAKPYAILFRRLKAREASLERTQAELETRVRERTADLHAAVAALRDEVRGRRLAEDQARHVNRVLRGVRAIHDEVSRSWDSADLLARCCDSLTTTRGYEAAGVALVDAAGRWTLGPQVGMGNARALPPFSLLLSGTVCRCVLAASSQRRTVPLRGEDCSHAIRAECVAREHRLVALRHEARVYGLLCVESADGLPGDDEEDELLVQMGEEIGSALQRGALEAQGRHTAGRLRALESRTETILETVPDLLVEVDAEGTCRWASASAQAFFAAPLVGALLPPGRAEGPDPSGAVGAETVWMRRADGVERLLERRARPMPSPEGAPATRLLVLRDVTEPRRSEESRRLAEEQFRQAQKLEAVGRLAGGVAHDFNNLLVVVLGYGQMLVDAFPAGDARRARAEQVVAAANRATSLTRQLLAFSRKQVVAPESLDLNEVIRDLTKLLARLIGEDVRTRLVLADGLGRVRADRGQLEQVLMNLAVNARDAMPRGGTLDVRTSPARLAGEAFERAPASEATHVLLEVADDGCGMDENVRQHLFEPFFTTKGPGKGTGLGLATVYGIVQQAGGRIRVRSEVGRGSTFEIALPVFDEAPTRVPPAPPRAAVSAGHETVLVVEDDDHVRPLTRSILERHGYHVLTARSGEEALRIARPGGPRIHLLVTDVVMPGMSGPELCSLLSAADPDLRTLFVSGYTDDVLELHKELRSGRALLHKPFTVDALAHKVREVLGRPPSEPLAPGTEPPPA